LNQKPTVFFACFRHSASSSNFLPVTCPAASKPVVTTVPTPQDRISWPPWVSPRIGVSGRDLIRFSGRYLFGIIYFIQSAFWAFSTTLSLWYHDQPNKLILPDSLDSACASEAFQHWYNPRDQKSQFHPVSKTLPPLRQSFFRDVPLSPCILLAVSFSSFCLSHPIGSRVQAATPQTSASWPALWWPQ